MQSVIIFLMFYTRLVSQIHGSPTTGDGIPTPPVLIPTPERFGVPAPTQLIEPDTTLPPTPHPTLLPTTPTPTAYPSWENCDVRVFGRVGYLDELNGYYKLSGLNMDGYPYYYNLASNKYIYYLLEFKGWNFAGALDSGDVHAYIDGPLDGTLMQAMDADEIWRVWTGNGFREDANLQVICATIPTPTVTAPPGRPFETAGPTPVPAPIPSITSNPTPSVTSQPTGLPDLCVETEERWTSQYGPCAMYGRDVTLFQYCDGDVDDFGYGVLASEACPECEVCVECYSHQHCEANSYCTSDYRCIPCLPNCDVYCNAIDRVCPCGVQDQKCEGCILASLRISNGVPNPASTGDGDWNIYELKTFFAQHMKLAYEISGFSSQQTSGTSGKGMSTNINDGDSETYWASDDDVFADPGDRWIELSVCSQIDEIDILQYRDLNSMDSILLFLSSSRGSWDAPMEFEIGLDWTHITFPDLSSSFATPNPTAAPAPPTAPPTPQITVLPTPGMTFSPSSLPTPSQTAPPGRPVTTNEPAPFPTVLPTIDPAPAMTGIPTPELTYVPTPAQTENPTVFVPLCVRHDGLFWESDHAVLCDSYRDSRDNDENFQHCEQYSGYFGEGCQENCNGILAANACFQCGHCVDCNSHSDCGVNEYCTMRNHCEILCHACAINCDSVDGICPPCFASDDICKVPCEQLKLRISNAAPLTMDANGTWDVHEIKFFNQERSELPYQILEWSSEDQSNYKGLISFINDDVESTYWDGDFSRESELVNFGTNVQWVVVSVCDQVESLAILQDVEWNVAAINVSMSTYLDEDDLWKHLGVFWVSHGWTNVMLRGAWLSPTPAVIPKPLAGGELYFRVTNVGVVESNLEAYNVIYTWRVYELRLFSTSNQEPYQIVDWSSESSSVIDINDNNDTTYWNGDDSNFQNRVDKPDVQWIVFRASSDITQVDIMQSEKSVDSVRISTSHDLAVWEEIGVFGLVNSGWSHVYLGECVCGHAPGYDSICGQGAASDTYACFSTSYLHCFDMCNTDVNCKGFDSQFALNKSEEANVGCCLWSFMPPLEEWPGSCHYSKQDLVCEDVYGYRSIKSKWHVGGTCTQVQSFDECAQLCSSRTGVCESFNFRHLTGECCYDLSPLDVPRNEFEGCTYKQACDIEMIQNGELDPSLNDVFGIYIYIGQTPGEDLPMFENEHGYVLFVRANMWMISTNIGAERILYADPDSSQYYFPYVDLEWTLLLDGEVVSTDVTSSCVSPELFQCWEGECPETGICSTHHITSTELQYGCAVCKYTHYTYTAQTDPKMRDVWSCGHVALTPGCRSATSDANSNITESECFCTEQCCNQHFTSAEGNTIQSCVSAPSPTLTPTRIPTMHPTLPPLPAGQTYPPSPIPTDLPTSLPTQVPTVAPTSHPSPQQTSLPTRIPSIISTSSPTVRQTPKPHDLATFKNYITIRCTVKMDLSDWESQEDFQREFEQDIANNLNIAVDRVWATKTVRGSIITTFIINDNSNYPDEIPASEAFNFFKYLLEFPKRIAKDSLIMRAIDSRSVECINGCPGGLTSTDIVSLVGFGIFLSSLVVFAAAKYKAMKNLTKSGHFSSIVVFGMSLFDFIGDIAFIIQLYGVRATFFGDDIGVNTLFYVGITLLGASCIANLSMMSFVFHKEAQSSNVKNYFRHYQSGVTLILMVSLTNIDSMRLLTCQAFGLGLLSAPFSDYTKKMIALLGLVGNLLEDIPQFLLQLAVLKVDYIDESSSITTYLALTGTALALAYGIIGRCIFVCVEGFAKTRDLNRIHRTDGSAIIPTVDVPDPFGRAEVEMGHMEDNRFEDNINYTAEVAAIPVRKFH